MVEWRQLKFDPKTAHLFEKVDVMQQPAAVTDSVIFTWIAEEQAETYGASLWTRDVCGGAGGGDACATAMFAAGQMANYIAAKMTAVLQPTDTDFAFLLKRFAEECKLQHRQEKLAALAQLGLEPGELPRHYGALEILTVVDAALRKLEQRTLDENLILKSLARNGFLEYRPVNPGTEDMKLVRTAGQAWRDGLPNPADSHRLQPGWVSRRWSYVDEDGKPAVPMKFDDEFTPEARSVALPEEVVVYASEAGDVAIRGPEVEVAGVKYEEVQCFLGETTHQEAVEKELERLTDVQKSIRTRLLELDTSEALRNTLQKKAAEKKRRGAAAMAARSGEALETKLKARKETNEKLRKQLLETGWSVPKLVGSLEPRVGKEKKPSMHLKNKRRLVTCLLKKAAAKAKAKSAAKSGAASTPAAKSLAKSGACPPPAVPPCRRPADRFELVPEACKRAWLCSEFLRFNTMPRAGDDGPDGWAAELSSGAPMLLPGELMDLWIRFHIWNGGSPLQVGYMETYTLVKLKDAEDIAARDRILEMLEEKFKHCSHLFLPICAGAHWVLLQASQETRTVAFADSLNGPVSDVILENAGEALRFWSLLASWSWVPVVVPARWNTARQGPLECGFYVATWLERAILKIAGRPTLEMTARVNVRQLKGRLLKMLCSWGPTMTRLQAEVPPAVVDPPPPAGDGYDELMEELRRAAEGFRAGEEPTGDAERPHLLENYDNEDEWAAAVMELLTEEHKAQCTEVHLKALDEKPCVSGCSGGCRHCVFWRAVRYWRNVETGGKATEGYDRRSCSLARLKGNVGSQVGLLE